MTKEMRHQATTREMRQLVEDAGFINITIQKYRLRVFTFLFWGMQTITFNKRKN